MLPGLDGTGLSLQPVLRALPPLLPGRAIAYPDDPAAGYDVLRALVNRSLPSTGRFALVAESFSGPIAIQLASERRRGLAAVILVATFASCPRPTWGRLARPFVGEWMLARPLLAMAQWAMDGSGVRGQNRPRIDVLESVSKATLVARFRAVLGADVREAAARIRVPALVIGAAQDRLVPRAAVERLARAIPNSVLSWIPGPHRLLQNAPERAAGEITRFLG